MKSVWLVLVCGFKGHVPAKNDLLYLDTKEDRTVIETNCQRCNIPVRLWLDKGNGAYHIHDGFGGHP